MAFTRSDTANGTAHLITTGFRSILIPVNTAQPDVASALAPLDSAGAVDLPDLVYFGGFVDVALALRSEMAALRRELEELRQELQTTQTEFRDLRNQLG